MQASKQKITVGVGTSFRSTIRFTPGGVMLASGHLRTMAQKLAVSENVLYVPSWVTSEIKLADFLSRMIKRFEDYAKNTYLPDGQPRLPYLMCIPLESNTCTYRLCANISAHGADGMSIGFTWVSGVGDYNLNGNIIFNIPPKGLSDEMLQRNVTALTAIKDAILSRN